MSRKGKKQKRKLLLRQENWRKMIENVATHVDDGFRFRGAAGYKKPGSNNK